MKHWDIFTNFESNKHPVMNIIEELRQNAVNELFDTDTVINCWQVWGREIRAILGDNPSAQNILDVGDNLSRIFKSTGEGQGREQGALSGGGSGWESLITWYFNLCTVGSRAVALKKKSHLPTPIADSITVNYSNYACSSESDITVIVFPDIPEFTEDNASLHTSRGKLDKAKLDELVEEHFADFEVGIIQCKTNWNDNAQIPMLWDMIYSAGGFRGRQISVGRNNFSIQSLNMFTYSFVTVPTNKLSQFKTTSTSVGRVKNLSGGNYWGFPTSNGVARNVKEIFQNFSSGFPSGNIRISLTHNLSILSAENYFRI